MLGWYSPHENLKMSAFWSLLPVQPFWFNQIFFPTLNHKSMDHRLVKIKQQQKHFHSMVCLFLLQDCMLFTRQLTRKYSLFPHCALKCCYWLLLPVSPPLLLSHPQLAVPDPWFVLKSRQCGPALIPCCSIHFSWSMEQWGFHSQTPVSLCISLMLCRLTPFCFYPLLPQPSCPWGTPQCDGDQQQQQSLSLPSKPWLRLKQSYK